MKLKILLFSVYLLGFISASYADYSDGADAYLKKDYKIAFDELLPLAEQGHAKAQYILGKMYVFGQGVKKDRKKGFSWNKKSAKQGNPNAQYYLGSSYDLGIDVNKDQKKAFKWYKKAAEQGHAKAQRHLGSAYSGDVFSVFSIKSVKKDIKKSFYWYKKSAKGGDVFGQYHLARMYRDGLGVDKDDKQAFKWYKKAAKQGDITSQINLGAIYASGRGVLKDFEEAIKWFKKAVAQGSPEAEFRLGLMHYPKDMGKVKFWLKKAHESTNIDISQKAKKLWDDLELWKYETREDSSFTNSRKNHKDDAYKSGTGFYVDKHGTVLTNNHVVDGCNVVKIGQNIVTIKDSDTINDLAILQGNPTSNIAYFRAGKGIGLGDEVIVAGYPLRSILGSGLNITTGNVASLSGIGNDSTKIQITAPVNSGNSGGPLLDRSGRIVGVVVSKINTSKAKEILGEEIQGANFAINNIITRKFLLKNSVDYEVSKRIKEKPINDIAEDAKKYTVLIKCSK